MATGYFGLAMDGQDVWAWFAIVAAEVMPVIGFDFNTVEKQPKRAVC